MSSWYGQSSTKQQIQTLLEKKPRMVDLFTIPEFCQQLKSFNPKLLDYISNNPDLIQEAISYIAIAPSLNDSSERKYKYPLMAVETIQTETTCVLNSFFRQSKEEPRLPHFDQLFTLLSTAEVLPLLAGYFFRANLCLLSSRFKETVERVYANGDWFQKLLSHSQEPSISSVLQLYINLDANKSSSQPNQRQKATIKMETLGKIIAKISNEARLKSNSSYVIIENLTGILIQTIEKYYLIADGTEMMEVITSQTCVDTMLILLQESGELAYPAMNFFIALINYYSFSSLNSEEKHNTELSKKNQQRLESQPMIVGINDYFGPAMDKIFASDRMTLHHYRILEVLCHMISISSRKILNTIRETKFFQSLINLLFKFEESNILHMLIEKSFLHIFISERTIYDDYKKHLFCEVDIIQITASKFLQMYPDQQTLAVAKRKGYFGHFMRILKIYSGIQTTDEQIVSSIKSKSQTWNKISKTLIKPYQSTCYKDLGSYTDVPEPTPLDFKIKKSYIEGIQPQNSNAIEQVKREQEIQNMKNFQNTSDNSSKRQEQSPQSPFNGSGDKFAEDLFKTASNSFIPETSIEEAPLKKLSKEEEDFKEPEVRKSESFQEFMGKKKVEVGNQMRRRRSISNEGRLSGHKPKLTSPSPNKKNSWKTEQDNRAPIHQVDQGQQNRLPPANTVSKKVLNQSTLVERTNHHLSENNSQNGTGNSDLRKITQSMVSLEDLKKIRVIQIQKPAQKKYRRMEQKDKLLLDFLGIAY